jgi:uncharacterized SAM-dependent methyltransferase
VTWRDDTKADKKADKKVGTKANPEANPKASSRQFEEGERLHTENSYKYTVEGFAALLNAAGFKSSQRWLDERGWFAVFWAQT